MFCNTLIPGARLESWAWNTCNRVTFSALKDYSLEAYNAPTYSIKYVVEGTENYFINKRKVSVGAGHYLLINHDQPIDLIIHAKKEVIGFCIHLKPDLLRKVFTDLSKGESWLLDHPSEQVNFPQFEELLYSDKDNSLGEYLQRIALHFNAKTATLALEENELYFDLACRLLHLQNNITTDNRNLKVLRSSTKTELLKRLAIAKVLIDTCDDELLNVETIARQSMLSSSHLFRNFKNVYGISPYQYFLQGKIKRAAHLLSTKKMSVSEAAFEFGFPDLASFSKAFKKVYSLSPIQYLRTQSL
jgi:AraC-like DNA-binding protein